MELGLCRPKKLILTLRTNVLSSLSPPQSLLTHWQWWLQPRPSPRSKATRCSSPVRCLGQQSSTRTCQLAGTCAPQRRQPLRRRSWSPSPETLSFALGGRTARGWQRGTWGWTKPAPQPTDWLFTSCSQLTRACSTARLQSGFRTQMALGLQWPANRATRLSSAFSRLVSTERKIRVKEEIMMLVYFYCRSSPVFLADTQACGLACFNCWSVSQ